MTILKMSLLATILISVIVVIRIFAINKLPKKTFIILWGIALCRLLIPLSVPSHISLPPAMSSVSNFITDSKLVETLMFSPVHQMTANIPMQSEKIIEDGYLSSVPPYLLIWFAGIVLMATFFLVTHLRCLREYKTALPIQNRFIEQWLSEQPRKIKLRQSDKIMSPLTYGIWRPVILLPKTMDYSDTSRLKYVLTHELIHIKRFDTLAKWLLVAMLCIHWFNPLVWVMYVLANRDIELSCDEEVVRVFGESAKSSYARTLISMAETRSKWVPLYSNFSKNSIEERIVAIMKVNKSNVLGVILVITLVLVTTFATSADSAKSLRSLSLYEHVDALDDVYQYANNINYVYGDTVIEMTEEHRMYIQSAFFTDHHVYAIIGLEGNVSGDPAINGRIVSDDEQTVYKLDGKFKEIEKEEEVRYFFYTGKITETVGFRNKELVKATGDNFLKSNRLSDHEGTLLELGVDLNGIEYQFHTTVENVSTDVLILHPDASNYESDFYETILLTPDGLNMTGSSEKLTEEWVQPHIKMMIVHTDGTEINLSYDTRGSISDEGFPMSLSHGHSSDTGDFSAYWNFRQWELDLTEVAELIIDGITYRVN